MRKIKLLLLLGLFLSSVTMQAQDWVQIGSDIVGELVYDLFGNSVSLSSDGSVVAIGASGYDDFGLVRVFENKSGIWQQIGLDIEGEASGVRFGCSVSLSSDGSVVAIGDERNDDAGTSAGHVRIYRNNSGSWEQIGSDIDGEAAGDRSGYSVCLSPDGSVVAIGALYNDGVGNHVGHVRIYENNSGIWQQIGVDLDGEAAEDKSGVSISLSSDGSIVAIGAYKNDGAGSDAGHVRVYENNSGVWQQIGSDIDGEEAFDSSGSSVSLSSDGSIVAIGASGNDGSAPGAGHVRVYKNNSGTWEQIGNDIDGEASDNYSGIAVSINSDGSIIAIGAYKNDGLDSNSGHVRIYENNSGVWEQIGSDIDGETSGDWFGISVSLNSDGSILAVGAPQFDVASGESGYVRVYSFDENSTGLYKMKETNISVYPNVSNGQFTIENAEGYEVTFIDIRGKVIDQRIINDQKSDIDLQSKVSSGVYIINFKSGAKSYSAKLIIE